MGCMGELLRPHSFARQEFGHFVGQKRVAGDAVVGLFQVFFPDPQSCAQPELFEESVRRLIRAVEVYDECSDHASQLGITGPRRNQLILGGFVQNGIVSPEDQLVAMNESYLIIQGLDLNRRSPSKKKPVA